LLCYFRSIFGISIPLFSNLLCIPVIFLLFWLLPCIVWFNFLCPWIIFCNFILCPWIFFLMLISWCILFIIIIPCYFITIFLIIFLLKLHSLLRDVRLIKWIFCFYRIIIISIVPIIVIRNRRCSVHILIFPWIVSLYSRFIFFNPRIFYFSI